MNSIFMVLKHATKDTVLVIPILYLIYLLVSYFEHSSHKHVNFFKKAKNFGPIIGASLGTIPQCGFSVAMADLYNKKNITLGTLIAVFIATSDEAIPIMFSDPNYILPMIVLISIKFIYAILCGYVIDLILKLFNKRRENKLELIAKNHNYTAYECGHEHYDHEHTDHCCADNIFLDALKHTLKISLFIFVVNLIFASIHIFTEFEISIINNLNPYIQPLITSLIGLIPNCVASVLLVETFMAGGITFGALLAGLATGAGVGLLVLFKHNKKEWLKNLLIIFIVYGLGVLLGELLTILNLNFI